MSTEPATLESARPEQDVVAEAARRLQVAAETQVPCQPVRALIGSEDVTTAYAVQELNTARRLAGGATVVGRKIGLTSPAVQRQLGVDRPDFGVLFEDMDVSASEQVPSGRLMQPKAEAEIAFILGADLIDGPLDDAQIRSAVQWVIPALEIVDSRIAGWDITFGDTVADNASSGLFVLGDVRRSLAEFEPVTAVMRMYLDDTLASEGDGAACLGDPLLALGWLARTARDVGDPLRAGQVILSGALGPMVATTPGSRVRAEIDGLGEVEAVFSAGDAPV